jgi:glycosyltransferase involved in cell wall biosynthesis
LCTRDVPLWLAPKKRLVAPCKRCLVLLMLALLAITIIVRYFWHLSTVLKSFTDTPISHHDSSSVTKTSIVATVDSSQSSDRKEEPKSVKTDANEFDEKFKEETILDGQSAKLKRSGEKAPKTMFLRHPVASVTNESGNRESVIFEDKAAPHYRPLMNRFLMGKYYNNNDDNGRRNSGSEKVISPHDMDAVIMASAPDPALAISIHNLYHLMGFRRFIFVVNNATQHCSTILDLVPQHNQRVNASSAPSYNGNNDPRPPHVCLDHWAFYSASQVQAIRSNYPQIHRGPPGKNKRGKRMVQVPRMGWYLQQFSKLLIDQVVVDLSQRYLAIDGDLIFTRPFSFTIPVDTTGTTTNDGQPPDARIVLPVSSKSPQQWRYFVDLLFGRGGSDSINENDMVEKNNYVVGWMVLDRTIVHHMIDSIDQRLADQTFPLNILDAAEGVISNSTYFSEFYTYARFALQHSSHSYIPTKIAEPARNPGSFQYTCILRKSTYQSAQSNLDLAPFMIWEEHKQHAFQSCPHGESFKTTTLRNVGIWHDFMAPPWGGGNQFLLALRRGLDALSVTVVGKNDPGGKELIQNSSHVLLANSITFRGETTVLDHLKNRSKLALVHRVDGPYHVARYFRSLNFTGVLKSKHLPEEDKKTKRFNKNYACATIFQSQWSLQANTKIGLPLRNPVIIPNTVDPEIFYWAPRPSLENGRKLVIVASSHSDNARKGFDTMLWLDAHLDHDRFEFVYIGGRPNKPGSFDIQSNSKMRLVPSGDSASVADVLRQGDIYFACSRHEPASNAVMEALACGLPVLYQRGSSHGDLVGKAGVGFDGVHDLLPALDMLASRYNEHVRSIFVPDIQEVSKQYLAIMRWCFYMKHVLVLESGY